MLQPLDYYVWAIVGAAGTIIVDTGFDAAMGEKRQREMVKPVGDGLRALGIEPGSVETIIISHMHYDHVGNYDLFPRARYHLQDDEMGYATGRYDVPQGAAPAVRDRRRDRDGAQALCRSGRVP